ncbi:MAG: di-trans,poly-cis-decaprenylcistransferase [Methanotrichaceae archaeon]|nr:di-trans,poly-cis-decaprenylcistransferase [Methanotrichaceae archaeon]
MWSCLVNLSSLCYSLYERILKRQIADGPPICHVAIVQDGNRRYARRKGISLDMGHSLGAVTTEMVSDWCLELGIKHLTVYAFSTENFKRTEKERSYLFDLIRNKLLELSVSEKVHQNKVRVRAIGRLDLLPAPLREAIDQVDKATRGYSQLYLNVALAYGGQGELVDAARSLAIKVMAGEIRSGDVDEEAIASHLYPHGDASVPKVDLIIRTGGDVRTSNFLPWQSNGNECAAYFCAPFWPEFRMIDFLRAIRTAQGRPLHQQA